MGGAQEREGAGGHAEVGRAQEREGGRTEEREGAVPAAVGRKEERERVPTAAAACADVPARTGKDG